jgi:2-dehydro-3-deoxyglucarate aldolase/4-hydroxy-2-oxoheptanedioate aldolase
MTNPVKETLASGGVSLGTMAFEFASPGLSTIAANAGAEFVIFDMEHSGWGIDTIRQLLATSRGVGIVPLVRVPTTLPHLLSGPLDAGAHGLMIPMVESGAQARLIADATRYPPVGKRGSAFGLAHDGFTGGDIVAKMTTANERLLLIAQIETEAGVNDVDAIAATDGIDLLWIGHFDLSASLGIPGQFDHPRYLSAVDEVLAACARHGKTPGIMANDVATARRHLAAGFRAIAYSGDLWIYGAALQAGLG